VNEKFTKLAEQAGLEIKQDGAGYEYYKAWPEDLQKFAESIVRECCQMANERIQHNNPHDCILVLDIKEHFDIEPECGCVRGTKECKFHLGAGK